MFLFQFDLSPAGGVVQARSLPPVVNISSFKNGYALVTREVKVDANGDAEISGLAGAIGTVWFIPDTGMKVDWVRTGTHQTTGKQEFVDIDSILSANVGKVLQLTLKDDDALGQMVTGKLEKYIQRTLIFRVANVQHIINIDRIVHLAGVDGELTLEKPFSFAEMTYKIHTSGSPGKVRYTALQSGFGWAPNYAISLDDDSHLTIRAKTTLFNSLDQLRNVTVRMVTGFPNTLFASYNDPLSMDYFSYLSMISHLDIDNPVQQNIPGMMSNSFALGGQGGGMGGGGFAGRASDRMAAGQGLVGGDSNSAGEPQAEDQYTFTQTGVDVDANGRATYDLFSAKCSFERVFRCHLTEANLQGDKSAANIPDVWQIIQFKNDTGKPLTTAIAGVFDHDNFLGQAAIKYTPAGTTGEIKLAKALSISIDGNEGETGRDRGVIKSKPADRKVTPIDLFDSVTITGTVQVTNTKDRPVTVILSRDIQGEPRDPGGAKYTPSTKTLRQINRSGKLEWKLKIEPGKTDTIRYSYRMMVASPTGE